MKSFLEFIQFVKMQSRNLEKCYFSGNLKEISIAASQDDILFTFRPDYTIWMTIERKEILLLNSCSYDRMKNIFIDLFISK